jgi:hypothetical protein
MSIKTLDEFDVSGLTMLVGRTLSALTENGNVMVWYDKKGDLLLSINNSLRTAEINTNTNKLNESRFFALVGYCTYHKIKWTEV